MSIKSFFYKKTILKEQELKLSDQRIHCDDIGLFSAYKSHNLNYNHISLKNDLNWKNFNNETLSLVILNLLIKETITVTVCEYKEDYFGGLNTQIKRKFLIKIKNTSNPEKDLLSHKYLEVLKRMSIKNKEICFHTSIYKLFDKFLGEGERYVKPEKKFFVKNLNSYVEMHNWVELIEDYSVLGPLYKYNLSIEPIYIPRLKMQHGAIYSFHKKELKSNVNYKQLNRRLIDVMEFNYTTRFFLQNSSSSRYQSSPEYIIPSIY